MNTFARDYSLPALPVPDLRESCAEITHLIEPLVDQETFAATKRALDDFCRDNGAGETLQKALLRYKAGLSGNASWLRPLWDDMYKSWRGSLPLDMNYYFRFDSARWGKHAACARLCLALANVFRQLACGNLAPERARSDFLSMDQARMALYTRIPGRVSDTLVTLRFSGPQHIAAVCKGHWFQIPLQRTDGQLVCENALAGAFAAVRQYADTLPEATPVSAMTCALRPEAAALREELLGNAQNRLSLAIVEQALFVVCLDPDYDSEQGLNHALLSGDAGCRWFDKSLQIIADRNGGLGANFEHAGCDAAIWVYLLSHADADLMDYQQADRPGDEASSAAAEALAEYVVEHQGRYPEDVPVESEVMRPRDMAYRLLHWEVEDVLADKLHALRRGFTQRGADVCLQCMEFPELARNALKQLKTSPDAFLQTAFQVAQYKLFGELRSSYEAVAMRGFAFGRTECARGSTAEAVAFARALLNGSADGSLPELYSSAERAHLARLVRCQRGQGVERHMYGLAVMYELHAKDLMLTEKPALFSDPGWLTLKRDSLSTSGIGAPFIRFFGYGPVVGDGLGIGYAPGKACTGLAVTASGAHSDLAEKFMTAFAEASRKMTDLSS